MSPLDFVLFGLATWRVSHILLRENGPFRVFRNLREALGVRYYDEDGHEIAEFKYEITTCIWCLSVWVAGALAVLWSFLPLATFWICAVFAASALAVVVDHHEGVK